MRKVGLSVAALTLIALVFAGCLPARSDHPASTDDTPAPALAGAGFNLIGTAVDCPSTGGCGYFLELDGESRHDRVKLFAGVPPDVGPDEAVTTYDLELDSRLSSLAPGAYSVTLSSVSYSDTSIAGEPGRERSLASCSTGFVVDPAVIGGFIVNARFSGSDCTGSTQFLDFTSQPPYELVCGPIEPLRCRDLAERAARAALLHYPSAHVESITFTGLDGDYELLLDNGTGIGMIVN